MEDALPPSNFINSSSTAPPVVTHAYSDSEPVPVLDMPATKEAYTEAIQHIVEEENRLNSTLPVYKGLERYNLLERMGDGAFSVVYKAFDTKTKTLVAVKAVQKQDPSISQVSIHSAWSF